MINDYKFCVWGERGAWIKMKGLIYVELSAESFCKKAYRIVEHDQEKT